LCPDKGGNNNAALLNPPVDMEGNSDGLLDKNVVNRKKLANGPNRTFDVF
jgi:hypothetical protein